MLEAKQFILHKLQCSGDNQWQIQDFPEGGGCQLPRWGCQPIIWPNFYLKLHENERIWTQTGGRVPGATP